MPSPADAAPPTPALVDDLGFGYSPAAPPRRVVSLVPSLTEAIAVSAPQLLVGATDWCLHPAGLRVTRVRGTKNPDLRAIEALAPDLVVCNQEENRELDVRRLRAAGIAVWVTRIETLDQAFTSLDRLFTVALGTPRPAWLDAAEAVWAEPATGPRRRAVIPIWRDPWMVVGPGTFTADLLDRLGYDNVFGGIPTSGSEGSLDRYPHVEVTDILATAPDLVILPDEPYVFTADDGPEAFDGISTVLVRGRDLTWYGPSLVAARAELLGWLARVR
ncbi:helical backbone metal receptor [Jatrophihabitans lederbergiae]|uniref:Helical backbone metal receptor n=1 Tax=Jatrophihabitans lederbergiae TaxID=3075547 RepID=A0ABU2J6G2_9ACTN|nr:helical backbone metal receptor [Jatrophihabitans sp. DSM 44399]MDT0260576.1 helical backbone metal receptor [Jatrophihabitans sp. DSM 44399]